MATISPGTTQTEFFALGGTVTVTPSAGARASVNGRTQDGGAIPPREVYSATDIAVPAGGTLNIEAVGGGVDYFSSGADPAAASAVRGAALLTRNVALAGDSRQDAAVYESPDHLSRIIDNRSTFGWLQSLYGNPCDLVQCAGIGGDTIAQQLARWDSKTAGELFGSANGAGGYGISPFITSGVILMDLGINTLENTGVPLSQMVADAQAILAKARAGNNLVIWYTEAANGSSNAAYDAAYRNRLLRWNKALTALQLEFPYTLRVVDMWSQTVNPTDANGYTKSGILVDNDKHYGANGARTRAQLTWPILQSLGFYGRKILPTSVADVYNASTAPDVRNINADPLMQGTPASATGTTGWQAGSVLPATYRAIACTNATVTSSIVAHPDGYGNCVQLDIDFTAAGGQVAFRTPALSTLVAAGDKVVAGAYIKAVGRSGSTAQTLAASHNLCGVFTLASVIDAEGNKSVQMLGGHIGSHPAIVGDFVHEQVTFPPITVAASPSLVQGSVYVTGTGAGSVRILVGQFMVNR